MTPVYLKVPLNLDWSQNFFAQLEPSLMLSSPEGPHNVYQLPVAVLGQGPKYLFSL